MNEYTIADASAYDTKKVTRQKRAALDSSSLTGAGAIVVGTVLLYVVYSSFVYSKEAASRVDASAVIAKAQEFVRRSTPVADGAVFPSEADAYSVTSLAHDSWRVSGVFQRGESSNPEAQTRWTVRLSQVRGNWKLIDATLD